jgi:hypothetical protein
MHVARLEAEAQRRLSKKSVISLISAEEGYPYLRGRWVCGSLRQAMLDRELCGGRAASLADLFVDMCDVSVDSRDGHDELRGDLARTLAVGEPP